MQEQDASLVEAEVAFRIGVERLEDEETAMGLAHLANCLRKNAHHENAARRLVSELTWRHFPKLACRVLIHESPDHFERKILHLRISPDERWLASVSRGGGVKVWDLSTGESDPRFEGAAADVAGFTSDSSCVCLSLDGELRIVPLTENDSDRAVTIPDVGFSRQHSSWPIRAELSADDRRIVAATHRRLRTWDARTGELIHDMTMKKSVRRLALGRQGNILAAVVKSKDDVVVFDLDLGKAVFPALVHEKWIHDLSIAEDESRLATGCHDGKLRVWNLVDGSLDGEYPHGAENEGPEAVEFSPAGDFLVSGGRRSVKLWKVGRPDHPWKQTEVPNEIGDLRFSPNGRLIVIALADGDVRVWAPFSTLRTIEPLGSVAGLGGRPQKHSTAIGVALAFSESGRLVAAGDSDGSIRVWDLTAYPPAISDLVGPGSSTGEPADYSPDGELVACRSSRGGVLVHRTMDGAVAHEFRHGGTASYIRFAAGGRRLITGSNDGSVRVWDTDSGEPLCETLSLFDMEAFRKAHPGHSLEELTARDSHDGLLVLHEAQLKKSPAFAALTSDMQSVLVICKDGSKQVWELRSGRKLPESEWPEGIGSGAKLLHSDGRVWIRPRRGTFALWEVESGRQLPHLVDEEFRDPYVFRSLLSPDGHYAAAACRDSFARIWRLQNDEALIIHRLRHRRDVSDIHFSPNSKRLVTCSRDQTARIWDVVSGEQVAPTLHHPGLASVSRFSEDGAFIATSASRGHSFVECVVRLWDSRSGVPIGEFDSAMRHGHLLFFENDTKLLGVGSFARWWSLENVDLPEESELLIQLAEQRIGIRIDLETGTARELTWEERNKPLSTAPQSEALKWLLSDPMKRAIQPGAEESVAGWRKRTLERLQSASPVSGKYLEAELHRAFPTGA